MHLQVTSFSSFSNMEKKIIKVFSMTECTKQSTISERNDRLGFTQTIAFYNLYRVVRETGAPERHNRKAFGHHAEITSSNPDDATAVYGAKLAVLSERITATLANLWAHAYRFPLRVLRHMSSSSKRCVRLVSRAAPSLVGSCRVIETETCVVGGNWLRINQG